MKMTPLISRIVVVFALIALSSATGASQNKFGAGFIFGEPTGVSWKYRMNSSRAVDGAIGFSPYDRFRVHVDYLWQSHPFTEQRLSVHYGVGAAAGFGRTDYVLVSDGGRYIFREREIGFGMRGVMGLTYLIPDSPLDMFFEVAPLMILTPDAGMGVDAGLGARVYF